VLRDPQPERRKHFERRDGALIETGKLATITYYQSTALGWPR
jgi:hypothetical protein